MTVAKILQGTREDWNVDRLFLIIGAVGLVGTLLVGRLVYRVLPNPPRRRRRYSKKR